MTRNQKMMLEWLGAKEEGIEDSKDFMTIVTEMGEFVCSTLCRRITEAEKKAEDLPLICIECEMAEFVCRLLNKNEAMKEKYAQITLCEDCRHRRRAYIEEDVPRYFCEKVEGICGELTPGSGCSKGRKKQ